MNTRCTGVSCEMPPSLSLSLSTPYPPSLLFLTPQIRRQTCVERECISNRNNVWSCEVESEVSCYRACNRGCLHEHLRRNSVYSLTACATSFTGNPPNTPEEASQPRCLLHVPLQYCTVPECDVGDISEQMFDKGNLTVNLEGT